MCTYTLTLIWVAAWSFEAASLKTSSLKLQRKRLRPLTESLNKTVLVVSVQQGKATNIFVAQVRV